jgi:hypothetical protein
MRTTIRVTAVAAVVAMILAGGASQAFASYHDMKPALTVSRTVR